ncbi:MAG: nitroreductase family protein [Chloroflexi bacterium]|nr:nitroreductase family protein [Chloroflexota bacterium]
MNVSEAIRTRRAIRNFAAQPVTDENVRATLRVNAGRRAQSSKNTRPWRFTLAPRSPGTAAARQRRGKCARERKCR